MKFLWKAWTSCKRATLWLLAFTLVNTAEPFVSALLYQPLLGGIFSDLSSYEEKLPWLILSGLAVLVLDSMRPSARRYATVEDYGFILGKFAKAVGEAQQKQLETTRASKVLTLQDAINDVVAIAAWFAGFLWVFATVGIVIYRVYALIGAKTAWLTLLYAVTTALALVAGKKMAAASKREHEAKKARNQWLSILVESHVDCVCNGTVGKILETIEDYRKKIAEGIFEKARHLSAIYVFFNVMEIGIVIGATMILVPMAREGLVDTGTVVQIIGLAGMMIRPANYLVDVVDSFSQAFTRLSDLENVLNYEEDPDGEVAATFNQGILVKMLKFRFPNSGINTLDIKRLFIAPGEFLGIAGCSGCGKSTLTMLLTRIYRATKGTITFDGIPIGDLTRESLSRLISVVRQDTHSAINFGTVRENLIQGCTKFSEELMWRALEDVGLASVIREKGGLEVDIGPGGINLSGGERQRLAIARALLQDRQILILDEATSALDEESQARVQERILELVKEGRTVIAIAHRMSTLRRCNRILVMEKGTVIDEGSHEKLMKSCDLYKRFNQY